MIPTASSPPEDDVVLAEIAVTNDLAVAGERRVHGRVVDTPDEPVGAREPGVGEDLGDAEIFPRSDFDLAFHEGEDLASLLVDAQEPGCAVEAHILEVA